MQCLALLCCLNLAFNIPSGRNALCQRATADDDSAVVWAQKTGLSPAEIWQLKKLSGAAEDETVRIITIDAQSLGRRKQVLVVTAGGEGHCLELYVYKRDPSGFDLVSALLGTPKGAGFCRDSPCDPYALVTNAGDIVVSIPTDYGSNGSHKYVRRITYTWNGHRYVFGSSALQPRAGGRCE